MVMVMMLLLEENKMVACFGGMDGEVSRKNQMYMSSEREQIVTILNVAFPIQNHG